MIHSKILVTLLSVTLAGVGGGLGHHAVAQTRLSPEPTVWDTSINDMYGLPINPSIYFMISGPVGYASDDLDPTFWRLSLSCEEVYCGITFDYIEQQQDYEGLPRLISSHWLNGADIAPFIGTDSDFLHDIHFVAWDAWDQVILREGDRYFRITINPDQSFTIAPIAERLMPPFSPFRDTD